MSSAVERFAILAGYASPAWPSGRPRRQSAREQRLVYGTRTAAARREVVVQPDGKLLTLRNPRTLDIARPSQTRGSSRIPDAQDIAHALGAVQAGSPDRDAMELGVRMLWDWITGEPRHPDVPSRAAPLIVPALVTGRRALRLDARARVAARRLASQACDDAYAALVTGRMAMAPPDGVEGDPDAERLWERVAAASLDLLTRSAEDAAAEALRVLSG